MRRGPLGQTLQTAATRSTLINAPAPKAPTTGRDTAGAAVLKRYATLNPVQRAKMPTRVPTTHPTGPSVRTGWQW